MQKNIILKDNTQLEIFEYIIIELVKSYCLQKNISLIEFNRDNILGNLKLQKMYYIFYYYYRFEMKNESDFFECTFYADDFGVFESRLYDEIKNLECSNLKTIHIERNSMFIKTFTNTLCIRNNALIVALNSFLNSKFMVLLLLNNHELNTMFYKLPLWQFSYRKKSILDKIEFPIIKYNNICEYRKLKELLREFLKK